jgi:methionine-rich copper-binding protein CopC
LLKKWLPLTLTFILLCVSVTVPFGTKMKAHANPETVEIILPVSEDAYINGGTNANTNYGTAADLQSRYETNLNYNRRTFLKFDLSSVTIPGDMISAVLYVNARKSLADPASTLNPRFVYEVTGDWTESALTDSNAPADADLALLPAQPGSSDIGLSFTVDSNASSWKSVDLTSHLKQKRSESASSVGLAILGTNRNTNPAQGTVYARESNTVYIKSKEAGPNNAPYIKIISTLTPSAGVPAMTEQSPANGAVHVPLDASLATTFQDEIFMGSQFSGIQLTKSGAPLPITASVSGRVLTVKPAQPLPHGSSCQLLIPAGAVNNSLGTPLAQDIVSSFSTILNNPYVSSTSPAANAYNIATNATIRIQFNETVSEQVYESVTLETYGTHQAVPVLASFSGQTLSVKPTAPLELGTQYQLVIPANAIKSSYGLPLAEPYHLVFKTIGSPFQGTLLVDSIMGLEEGLARALPGSEIILQDGTYANARPELRANGTADNPITVRSQTPGGVRFTGTTGFVLTGRHMIFRDFFFDRIVYKSGHSLRIVNGENIRVTGNYFYKCGDSDSAYNHIVRIDSNSSYNRIDHNTFEDSRGMSVGIKADLPNNINLYNTIDHNYFRNIRFVGDYFPGWTNGMEAVQIGQAANTISSYATVEYNLFENVTGDKAETISNKSSNNTIRYNTFLNSWSGPTNRYGNGSVFSGNFFFNGKDGIRNYGNDQIITNNYFFNVQNTPILLPSGSDMHERSENTKVVNNTILYSGSTSSIEVLGGDTGPFNTWIANNAIAVNRAAAIVNVPSSTTLSNNVIYAWGAGTVGNSVYGYIREDLGLTRNGWLFRPSAESVVVDYGAPYNDLPNFEDMDGQSRIGNPDAGADEISNEAILHKPLTIFDVGPEDKWWVPADYYSMGMILWNGIPLYGFKVELADYSVTLPGGTETPPVVEAYLWDGSKAAVEITQPTTLNDKATIRVLDLNGNPMKLFPTTQDAVYTIQFSPNSDQTKPSTVIMPANEMQDGWYPSGLTVSFQASDEGGSGVSRVEYRIDGAPVWRTYNNPVVIPDGMHTVEYRAIDKAGNVEESKLSELQVGVTVENPNQPTVPGAPTNVTATAGDSAATVSFTAPQGDGGSPVTHYEVTVSPGNRVVTGSASPITITGLANGSVYSFTVQAVNASGSSEASTASNSVTPVAQSTNSGETNGSDQETDHSVPSLDNQAESQPGTVTTIQADGLNGMKFIVDTARLDQQLAALPIGSAITIRITGNPQVAVAELSMQSLSSMLNKDVTIHFQTDRANYSIPSKELSQSIVQALPGAATDLSDVILQLKISQLEKDGIQIVRQAAERDDLTLLTQPLEFSIIATNGSQTVEVSNFDSYIERGITLPAGVQYRGATGIIIELDGTIRPVPTKIVEEGNQVRAIINSMTNSIYAIVSSPRSFLDVSAHWSRDAVQDMSSRLIVDGRSQMRFEPDSDLTRAEFATILVRALGLKLENSSSRFPDVAADAWYASSIQTAYKHMLISGYDDGAFRPDAKITREQAMAIIARAMRITSLASSPSASLLDSYEDKSEISAWAAASVNEALSAGIFTGRTNTLLAPQDLITRAEASVIARRLLQKSKLID